jgi:hypothetical protein
VLQPGRSADLRGDAPKLAEVLDDDSGTTRVLATDMLSAAALEQINFEQLATPTDRVLLRSRHARNRLSETKIVYRPAFKVELAEERLQIEPAAPARSEHTVFVRARRFDPSTTTAAILAALFSIALILLMMVPM